MSCDDIRERLTSYLDGDLDADRGTVVRGHLRGCEACRKIAEAESVVRDGLRALPPLDPPPSLWAGVQARLAAAEIEEARRPAWRRAMARWAPSLPRFAVGGLVAAAAIAVLWWRTHRGEIVVKRVDDVPSPVIESQRQEPPKVVVSPSLRCDLEPSSDDVTADLARDAARLTGCYAKSAEELLALAKDARARWTDEQRAAFDNRVETLRKATVAADEGKHRQRAYRALATYVRGALVHDDVVLASGGAP